MAKTPSLDFSISHGYRCECSGSRWGRELECLSVGEMATASAISPTLYLSISQPFGLQLCFEKVGGFVELQTEIVVEFGNRV